MRRLVDIADRLPERSDGATFDEAALRRRRTALAERDQDVAFLTTLADQNALSAYVWLSYHCAYSAPDGENVRQWLAAIPSWRETPLLEYRAATCGVLDLVALERLLEADPRFGELNFLVALAAPPSAEVDLRVARLEQALLWRDRWVAGVLTLAQTRMEREEYPEALTAFDRLLELRPQLPDALLGRVQALTHLARHEDALAETDALLSLGQWYIGDARFWRALNELQLGRLEPAWADVELAAELLVNGDVPKLAGVIATRRGQLDLARQRFELSRRRRPEDCETGFHLGNVLTQQRAWTAATDVYRDTTACVDRDEERLREEIGDIVASTTVSTEQRRKQVQRREQQIAAGLQMRGGAWFNTAVGYFNLSRFDEARVAAERVVDDPLYGSQARLLLTRLLPLTRP